MGKVVEILVEVNDIITYALQQNGLQIVRNITLKNNMDADIEDLIIRISSDNELVIPFEMGVRSLSAREEMYLKDIKIKLKGDFLASLTERISCILNVTVSSGGVVVANDSREITLLAFDEWPGLNYFPDLLAAFVTPNHPVIADLLQSASKWLNKWTGTPSLEGYQCNDPNRVKIMAAAVYAAIQECNITYANPPSSFETIGQRVRLCDAVMKQRLGTCMDMTLLYASVLEALGLNTILVLVEGHIFAGVWLVDESFQDPIVDDPSQLEKRMANGINELIVVECTAMCSGKSRNFDYAIENAERTVGNYSKFVFAIDVLRARKSGVRPLPIRVMTDSGFIVQHEEREERDVTDKPEDVGDIFDLKNLKMANEVSKQVQWERKLLDLTLRNMLINMRLTKAVVPLLTADISDLEDALVEGEEFQVTPRPLEWDIANVDMFTAESTSELGPYKELIALECRHKRLPTIYSEKELNNTLTKMYRTAKTSMEENGASTLYLALGLLRWFERKGGENPARYAPIVLVPIDIIRKSASKGYTMRMRDEDAQINITLLEFLKQSFDIQIGGLSPIPTDEHGLDMKKIFAIVRHAVMDEVMWDVIEAGFIGNFSFSQFVMWKDIHNCKDFLENNKIVNSLIQGAVGWDCTIPDSVNTDEAYLPITADSSQLRAINMAAGGVSFVLHGPPGTGKSQTITAMIANALTKGQTVLFVAEKMAALEVVQRRLSALGIADFCLELHSNKATKKAVLDQLKRGLEHETWRQETDYKSKIEDIRRMRVDLDKYVKTLHAKRSFGKSLRELIDIYEMIPEQNTEVRFNHDSAGLMTQSQLDNQKHILERLIAAGKGIGHPANHPLFPVKQTVYSQSLKLELHGVLDNYKAALHTYKRTTDVFCNYLRITAPITKEEWEKLELYAKSVLSAENIPDFLMQAGNIEAEFIAPFDYLEKKEILEAKKKTMLTQWNESIFRMDIMQLRSRYDEANKKFFGKAKALANIASEIQAYALFNVVPENIPVMLNDILVFQDENRYVENLENNLSSEWRVLVRRYITKDELSEFQRKIKKYKMIISEHYEQIQNLQANGELKECIQSARRLIDSIEDLRRKENAVIDLLDVHMNTSNNNWLESQLNLCDNILNHANEIKDWIIYRQFLKEAQEAGLAPICEVYEKGLAHDEVLNVYLKSIYKAIVLHVIAKEPALNSFTGIAFNERILQFKKLDEEFMELTKEEMYYKLVQQRPSEYKSVEISRELNILRRAISSNGRGMSIRTLFDQIPNVLKRLCPCMLMSPISVAQYLAAENEMVDIVVFDEASQLPTCKAVGVLARGKNAVIVGDPNQMPPTSFFAGNTVDEDNLDLEDLDSILDDCLALGMPQAHLQWHYRSRHESLIAFSNHAFYENQMLTFPSVNDREKRVTLEKVDGYFERGKGRVNRAEAESIIKEVKRRYKDPELNQQTIGIVTFNINQQTLIADLLQEEFLKNAAFDSWANTGTEQLFVKNLENVQGDERDVILFSIAFGPDSEGKLSMNFGPLNKEGGWKRLNVAVSRARSEMKVFTTMTADMIDLRRTKSKGVESLRDFLEYAEKNRIQGENFSGKVQKNQGILECICSKLTDAGFEYQKSVGHSNFKIDIAVINPYNRDEYLIGFMLDGESCKQSYNTKDREISQIGILEELGWEVHRIWAIDWWDNKEKELCTILQLVNAKKEEAQKLMAEASRETVGLLSDGIEEGRGDSAKPTEIGDQDINDANRGIETASKVDLEFKMIAKNESVASNIGEVEKKIVKAAPREYVIEPYVSAKVSGHPLSTSEYVQKSSMGLIVQILTDIIDIEAPVSYDRLIKKTLRAFGISRSSTQTLEATEKALKKVNAKVIRQNGIKFYWKEGQKPDNYYIYRNDTTIEDRRSADDVCQQEVKNAVCKTLQEKGVLDKDELIKETIRTMGYSRSGVALVNAVERGIKYGKKTGEIVVREDKKFIIYGGE